ncbi:hypothetical protein GCM10007160_24210 [Litchfieldella qijiaojingensis]|uniref:Uncharacterized protein n=1 Tax=Litchfieldella qijiaojingensis TaxID=980347 RepID=A0ABQ2YUI4_9GAMM|nr:hypothetical protein GCM10007160_24210 [Halomonas qijiaojingensis]
MWSLELTEADREVAEASHAAYLDALPRYCTALDPIFQRARDASEFNFLMSLFAIRGMQDAGWDPYETTVRAIESVRAVYNDLEGDAARHLLLWIYGHIMEASEPYELLANLLDVSEGGRFHVARFSSPRGRGPLSPDTKIRKLEEKAKEVGIPDAVVPMKEAWDRELRNAIFHADYSLYGPEVRTIRPLRVYSHDEIMTLVNRALAYHEALSLLRRMHIESYREPVRIPADEEFTSNPREEAVVIVKEGYGAVGLKDGWSEEELRRGCIPYRLGRFSYTDMEMLNANPTLALLPPFE